MGNQIIKQPDGKYAVFSTNEDSFLLVDASPEKIVEFWTDEAVIQTYRDSVVQAVEATLKAIDMGEKVYRQFTLSWEDAVSLYERVHKKKFDVGDFINLGIRVEKTDIHQFKAYIGKKLVGTAKLGPDGKTSYNILNIDKAEAIVKALQEFRARDAGRWYAALICYPINGRCAVAHPPDFPPHYSFELKDCVKFALKEVKEHEPNEDIKKAKELLLAGYERVRIGRIVVVIISGSTEIDWTGVEVMYDGALPYSGEKD